MEIADEVSEKLKLDWGHLWEEYGQDYCSRRLSQGGITDWQTLFERSPKETSTWRVWFAKLLSFCDYDPSAGWLFSLLNDDSDEVMLSAADSIRSKGLTGLVLIDGHLSLGSNFSGGQTIADEKATEG